MLGDSAYCYNVLQHAEMHKCRHPVRFPTVSPPIDYIEFTRAMRVVARAFGFLQKDDHEIQFSHGFENLVKDTDISYDQYVNKISTLVDHSYSCEPFILH